MRGGAAPCGPGKAVAVKSGALPRRAMRAAVRGVFRCTQAPGGLRRKRAVMSSNAGGGVPVADDAVHALVGLRRVESAAGGDVGTEFDVVHRRGVEPCGQGHASRVPGRLQTADAAHVAGQTGHLRRVAVAAHEAEAGDLPAVAFDQQVYLRAVERTSRILPEVGAVAPLAAVGTPREIEGEGHLARNLLEYDVVTDVFKHFSLRRVVRVLRPHGGSSGGAPPAGAGARSCSRASCSR